MAFWDVAKPLLVVHFIYRKCCTSMGVDSITNVQHSARNTSFLKSLIKIYIGKRLAQNRAQRMTQIQRGEGVKCFDYMLLSAVLQSIERNELCTLVQYV